MSKMIKLILVSVFSLASSNVFAATIAVDDTFGITGTYSAAGGADLSSITMLQLSSLTATSANGDFATTISGLPAPTGTPGGILNIAAFTEVGNFFTIEGWTLDLTSVFDVYQIANQLTIEGTGVISGNAFDPTGATWSFSSTSLTNYSMTVTSTGIPAVPVPAAVWLFGSGLLGLVGVARRKA